MYVSLAFECIWWRDVTDHPPGAHVSGKPRSEAHNYRRADRRPAEKSDTGDSYNFSSGADGARAVAAPVTQIPKELIAVAKITAIVEKLLSGAKANWT